MRDFFISYNKADKSWAQWIAWTLEEAGYSVFLQAWDFQPGSNFVLEMQRAAAQTEKTMAVLSEDYLNSGFTQPEWAAAFASDPQGLKRALIPVRVRECKPTGMLASVVYIDLVGLPEEDARIAVLGALSERAKPAHAPVYPGQTERVAPHSTEFPGSAASAPLSASLSHAVDAVVGAPELHGKRLSPSERVRLMQSLNSIPTQQFNMLIFALNPPPGIIPPMPAPQGDRTFTLLSWAESATGCGLVPLQQLMNELQNPT
jgi:hypothetical protein